MKKQTEKQDHICILVTKAERQTDDEWVIVYE